ncbi:MAG: MFS transporter [Clostridia bacterium]|nr:MFS transporter [Clostridia bacterium]MBQ6182463.1 MFS transporter [Clostridia bacterium]
MEYKLNYKRTMLIGLAFLSISAFWQLYDYAIPLILRDTFKIGDTLSGVIMAADNVLALFLLPILGALSDKVDTRIGKRMPFILLGTAVSAVLMSVLPFIDNSFYAAASDAKRVLFIGVLLFLLVSMAFYRSPAVALMPDLTPKPLRSKGNAVINLMGALGGIFTLILIKVLYSSVKEGEHADFIPIFLIIAGLMAVSVIILFFTVKEKRDNADVVKYDAEHPESELTVAADDGKRRLPPEVRKSLAFILASIALWFMAYNAVTTAFSKYATSQWGMSKGDAAFPMMIATGGAIISFLPVGIISSRIGRKRTILMGCALLTACFAGMAVYGFFAKSFAPWLYVMFVLVGFAWAAINVNSLPMVVEMCSGGELGKFTGLYYTFSMAAQVVTPILSGALLEHIGYDTLFPYAVVFAAASGVTMIFVRHGDNKPERKGTLESFADPDAD